MLGKGTNAMNTNPLKTIFTNILSMKGAIAMNHNSITRMVAKGLRLLFAAVLVAGLVASAIPGRIARAVSSVANIAAQQTVRTIVLPGSSFGDLDADYGGPGSQDDFTTYSPPSDFITWVEHSWPPSYTLPFLPELRPLWNSDNKTIGANFPFILAGHATFHPSRVISATLRVDLAVPPGPEGGNTIRIWDEQDTSGQYSIGYVFGIRVAQRYCAPQYWWPIGDPRHRPCWDWPPDYVQQPTVVSIDIDLTDGTSTVYELLDPNTDRRVLFSRPDGASAGCHPEPSSVYVDCPWGQILAETFEPKDRGAPHQVLDLAADGNLYGLVEDHTTLSYASLVVEVESLNFTVNSTVDAVDANPGDRVCASGAGECTLRAAIMEANALPGLDTIALPAGIYNLTILGDDEFGPSAAIGDLDILDDLNITGDGAGVTIIDGGRLTRSIGEYDRVFDIAPEPFPGGPVPDITVNLSGVTIRNGKTRDVGGGIRYASALTVVDSVIRDNEAAMGGGLARAGFNYDDPRLTLMNVTVSGNRALSEHGGGIFAHSSTSLTIQDSVIVDNRATNSGAGIYAVAVANPPTLTRVQVLSNTTGIGTGSRGPGGGIRGECLIITDSTISRNSANQGGGIFIGERSCPTVITNSTIGGNEADRNVADRNGGGILNFGNLSQPGGTLRVIDSTISGNQAGEGGGGIANGRNGTAEVISTTIRTNDALGQGGGIFNEGSLGIGQSEIRDNVGSALGGGIWSGLDTVLFMTESTVFSNTSNIGGGIYINSNVTQPGEAPGLVSIRNSTISGNLAKKNGAGIANVGRTLMLINNSTIAFNRANVENDGFDAGGGLDADIGRVLIWNTILAHNTDRKPDAMPGEPGSVEVSPDCKGTLVSRGHNLVRNGNGCTLAEQQNDQVGTSQNPIDPLLDTLQINAPGTIATHALMPGSPAIDAGNPAEPGSGGFACEATDQRGVLRPLGRHCDIGAFEAYPFPQDRVLDDFTRPDGSRRLGLSWSGSVGGYIVLNPEVDVEAGGPIYWKANLFGARQEAFVTLTRADPAGQHQSLLLKVQDNDLGQPTWRRGAIAVFYRATEGIIGIETYVPGQGWHTLATFPMTLRDGDQLSARALADGTVEAYVNGRFVGEANAGSFFAGKGGRIGLWFIVAADALLDDFGGGNVP